MKTDQPYDFVMPVIVCFGILFVLGVISIISNLWTE